MNSTNFFRLNINISFIEALCFIFDKRIIAIDIEFIHNINVENKMFDLKKKMNIDEICFCDASVSSNVVFANRHRFIAFLLNSTKKHCRLIEYYVIDTKIKCVLSTFEFDLNFCFITCLICSINIKYHVNLSLFFSMWLKQNWIEVNSFNVAVCLQLTFALCRISIYIYVPCCNHSYDFDFRNLNCDDRHHRFLLCLDWNQKKFDILKMIRIRASDAIVSRRYINQKSRFIIVRRAIKSWASMIWFHFSLFT